MHHHEDHCCAHEHEHESGCACHSCCERREKTSASPCCEGHSNEDTDCCGDDGGGEDPDQPNSHGLRPEKGECCCGTHGHDHCQDGDGCGCGHDHGEEPNRWEIPILIASAVLFAAGLISGWKLLFVAAWLVAGAEVLLESVKNILKGEIFDENFLMAVASIGAIAIGEIPEAAAVMLFYRVGEYFQGMAVRRSRRSISDLMDIRPEIAHIREGEGFRDVAPQEVPEGTVIQIKAGERIPLDSVVLEGESMVDTAALTGESMPREATPGSSLLSGCLNGSGVLLARTTGSFANSTVSRILEMVEESGARKAPTEKFITRFAAKYTPIVVGLALLIAVIPPLFTGEWSRWIYQGCVFLVISCPCALVLSVPLSYFAGIGGASRRGILFKGGNTLETLCHLDTVVFDKTGTLTEGKFGVTGVYPQGVTAAELLEVAALAESGSNHPIARSVAAAYPGGIDSSRVTETSEKIGRGLSARVDGRLVMVGNAAMMREAGIPFAERETPGTILYLAREEVFLGSIVIEDTIKPDSAKAMERLHRLGISRTVMLTGDHKPAAEAVAAKVGVDEFAAELLPQDKVAKVEELLKTTPGALAFVGDGINDAPVLARADVGVAMGALGSDAAIEAADVVLMTDHPTQLADAVEIARRTMSIVRQNIIFALAVKFIIMVISLFGFANMWEAVFADVGVCLIAVLNSIRALRPAKGDEAASKA